MFFSPKSYVFSLFQMSFAPKVGKKWSTFENKTFYINKIHTINKCYAYLFMNIAGNNLDKS